MDEFKQAAQEKFRKGAIEHEAKTPWKDIDPYAEIQQECLDIYNYAGHPKVGKKDSIVLRKFARFIYEFKRDTSR